MSNQNPTNPRFDANDNRLEDTTDKMNEEVKTHISSMLNHSQIVIEQTLKDLDSRQF